MVKYEKKTVITLNINGELQELAVPLLIYCWMCFGNSLV